MPVAKHVHTYIKYKSRPGYFRCAAADCTHYIDKESVIGKLSCCNQCGSIFTLSMQDARRAKPKCINCSNTKRARTLRKAQELTRYLGTDAFSSNLETVTSRDEETEDLDFFDQPVVFHPADASEHSSSEEEETEEHEV